MEQSTPRGGCWRQGIGGLAGRGQLKGILDSALTASPNQGLSFCAGLEGLWEASSSGVAGQYKFAKHLLCVWTTGLQSRHQSLSRPPRRLNETAMTDPCTQAQRAHSQPVVRSTQGSPMSQATPGSAHSQVVLHGGTCELSWALPFQKEPGVLWSDVTSPSRACWASSWLSARLHIHLPGSRPSSPPLSHS